MVNKNAVKLHTSLQTSFRDSVIRDEGLNHTIRIQMLKT